MKLLPAIFVVCAIISWGIYVPLIHHGQAGFGAAKAPFRAFLCVGMAYFLLAVLLPGTMIMTGHESATTFTTRGVSLSTFAGVVGAMGAVSVIFAMYFGGKPIYVAPIIFAGTPIVNTIVTMIWDKPKDAPSPLFFAGIAMAAIGAFLVLAYKPQ